MKLRWTTPSSRQLDAIGTFLLARNPDAAARIVTRIWSRVGSLADQPYQGREGRVPGTRELVISATPYIVAYRIRNEIVEILAVYHGAQKWPDHF